MLPSMAANSSQIFATTLGVISTVTEEIANSTQSVIVARSNASSSITFDHPLILFARGIYVWMIPLMVFVLLLSIIGNGMIVISSFWLGGPINQYNRLCISLAGADAWAASLLIAGLIVNSYRPVVLRIPKHDECIPALLEIFRISGMLTSNLHILALATNQFIGIVYPLSYKRIVTTHRIRVLILLLWLLPVLFVGSWFVVDQSDGFFNPRCVHRFYGHFPFRLCIFVTFIIPLFATFIVYAHILTTLLRAKAKCYGFSFDELRKNSAHRHYQRQVRSRLKLMWTTLLILSTFTMSWGVCVLYFVLVCRQGCAFTFMKSISFEAGLVLNSSVNFLVMLKLLLNPLIYALRMRHIREAIYDFLLAICPGPLRRCVIQPYRGPFLSVEGPSRGCSLKYSTSNTYLDTTINSQMELESKSLITLTKSTSSGHFLGTKHRLSQNGTSCTGFVPRRGQISRLSVPLDKRRNMSDTDESDSSAMADDESSCSHAQSKSRRQSSKGTTTRKVVREKRNKTGAVNRRLKGRHYSSRETSAISQSDKALHSAESQNDEESEN